MERTEKFILLDADVLIHLTKGGRINLLHDLFAQRLLVLGEVLQELNIYPEAKQQTNNMILFNRIEQYEIPKDIIQKVYSEYAKIRKHTPSANAGEAYCMAVAKHDNKIVASSNLRDIKNYCMENSIEYITTMDILLLAYEKGLMDEAECDYCIYNIKSRGSRLPFDRIRDFKASKSQI